MGSVSQKIVLVTGCSSGIGFDTALKFAGNGYKTYASVRNLDSEGAQKLAALKTQDHLIMRGLVT